MPFHVGVAAAYMGDQENVFPFEFFVEICDVAAVRIHV